MTSIDPNPTATVVSRFSEGGREPLPLPDQARHHEASEQQDGSVPQGGEPAEPPQGQDEPGAGQVPRQHQEAPKLMNDRVPGKGISAESVVCGLHSIQTLPPSDRSIRVECLLKSPVATSI